MILASMKLEFASAGFGTQFASTTSFLVSLAPDQFSPG
jgi:hypothetical protein